MYYANHDKRICTGIGRNGARVRHFLEYKALPLTRSNFPKTSTLTAIGMVGNISSDFYSTKNKTPFPHLGQKICKML